MTILEKFEKDKDLSGKNILFTMDDDAILGERGNGVFCKEIIDEGHECLKFVFDNGNQYIYDTEEERLYCSESIPKEYFIHKHIEKTVSDFLESNKLNNTGIFCSEYEVAITPLIKIHINRDARIVYIPNIHIPLGLQHKGLGKQLIKQIFLHCERLNYHLQLVQLVESFFNRLVSRGGKVIDFETIEIIATTKLD